MSILKQINHVSENNTFKISEDLFIEIYKIINNTSTIIIECNVYEKDYSDSELCNVSINIPYKIFQEKISIYENENSNKSTRVPDFDGIKIDYKHNLLQNKTLLKINKEIMTILKNNIEEIIKNGYRH